MSPPGPGGPGEPGPELGFPGGFFNGLRSTISSCFSMLCCCGLFEDCFGGPPGHVGPPPAEPPAASPGPPPR